MVAVTAVCDKQDREMHTNKAGVLLLLKTCQDVLLSKGGSSGRWLTQPALIQPTGGQDRNRHVEGLQRHPRGSQEQLERLSPFTKECCL